ncbi:uncharacterized protein LDX57_008296 [Aspergillus melleus]|uniref:uncharacterized protein n=1 Tax=Aspergillus melleus TaxID=138277 RepID=UPI001E8E03F6|nr:uncharacterized protein LDX57_008296 [Aspergillus melleus]KAH8430633.1 hypothetical protein LDX57_008296 [Aspergillus melleus]
MAEPRITFVHGGGSDEAPTQAAGDLHSWMVGSSGLREDEGYGACEINEGAMDLVALSTLICIQELRSQGSWISDVVLPLLRLSTKGLPLEVWSVQGESVRTKCRPRFRDGKTFDSQVDLVVGLPPDAWEEEYQQRGLNDRGWDFSHVNSPHTSQRVWSS